MPRGIPTSRPQQARPASPATPTNVIRQPNCVPINAPSGTPSATARLIPPVTMASARPRRAGGASAAANAFALGT